jgi:hypothetical protein
MFTNNDNFLEASLNSNETEMLQTDIQRFLAILAFCLLPIFMLVQAIPVVTHEDEAVIDKLSRRILEQRQELDRISDKNYSLVAEINSMRKEEKENEQLKRTLFGVLNQIEHQQEEIKKALQNKQGGNTDIGDLKNQVSEMDQTIHELNIETERLKKLTGELIQPRPDDKKLKPEPVMKNTDNQKVKGLYVAFKSDKAFLRLLSTKKTYLFIYFPDARKTYQVFSSSKGIYIEPGSPMGDLDLWEIQEIMVPQEILIKIKNYSTLSTKRSVFVVGLSSSLSQKIRGDVKSGRIIIDGDGLVTHTSNDE